MNKIFEQSLVHSLCDSVIEFENCYMPTDDSMISKQKTRSPNMCRNSGLLLIRG